MHHRCDECLSKGEHMRTCSKVGGPGYEWASRSARKRENIQAGRPMDESVYEDDDGKSRGRD